MFNEIDKQFYNQPGYEKIEELEAEIDNLAPVASTGNYDDLINKPTIGGDSQVYDIIIPWVYDGETKVFPIPEEYIVIFINYIMHLGLLLPPDNVAYTLNQEDNTITLGAGQNPTEGDILYLNLRVHELVDYTQLNWIKSMSYSIASNVEGYSINVIP